MKENNLKWMKEPVERMNTGNGIYKFACFFIGRKLTYEELYLVFSNINRRKLGDKKSKEKSFMRILEIYKSLNNKLPDGIE